MGDRTKKESSTLSQEEERFFITLVSQWNTLHDNIKDIGIVY